MIRSFAHWRLQVGERIGLLDLCYGSTTLTGTITTVLELRKFGLVEVVLALVWALSPLGGQAMLRVVSFQPAGEVSFRQVQYLDSSNSTFPQSLVGRSNGGYTIPVAALFLASVGAPGTTRNSSMDTWGNMKIPMVEQLPGFQSMESTEWTNVDATSEPPIYSSLLGIPTANVPSTGNSTFTVETAYMNVNCPALNRVPYVDIVKTRASMSPSDPSTCPCNNTFMWGEISTLSSQEGKGGAARCGASSLDSRSLMYFSFDNDGNGTFANCSMTTSYVELQVDCTGWNCSTTAVRPSTKQNPSANHTVLDACEQGSFPYLFPYFMQTIASFTDWAGSGSSGYPSALQVYLANPDQTLNASAKAYIPSLHTTSPLDFSIRLSQIINTYWTASVATEAVYLGHAENFDILSSSTNNISLAKAEATVFTPSTIIHCNRGWLAPLVLASAIMFLSAWLALFTDLRTWIPKVLMNMSTLTRGNPNFNLPPGGGVLSDEERSRLLKGNRVRFGEVMVNTNVGDLVIGSCEEDGGMVARLSKGKSYR